MITVFLGPPGSGKGTQAALLASRRGMRHLSTGELLRLARAAKTPLGCEAARYVDAGKLVPDDLVTGLVVERIVPNGEHYLLDGFPRNLRQATRLEELASETGHVLTTVVLLDVPEDELIHRLAGRGRGDDDPATIRKRLTVYAEETEPLIMHYHALGILRRVDGLGGVEEVHRRVVAQVE